jgi:5'(3')-deoxyribonucleotidase
MNKIDIVFLDMDGVIADWNKQFCNITNNNHEEIIKNWPAGKSEIAEVLGMNKATQWAIINRNPDFWIEIPIFDYAKKMVKYLKSKYEVHICTSPSSDPQSVADKLKWLSKHGLGFGNNFYVTKNKHLLAAPNRILIDDMDKNTTKFAAAGGQVLLFPQVWNSAGEYHGDKLELVKGLL